MVGSFSAMVNHGKPLPSTKHMFTRTPGSGRRLLQSSLDVANTALGSG
jgi:hypothetical protein